MTDVTREYYVTGELYSETIRKDKDNRGDKVINIYYKSPNRIRQTLHYKDDKIHGDDIQYYDTGKVRRMTKWINGKKHGIKRSFIDGVVFSLTYYLYGNIVTEEEYKKHELTEELAGLND